MSSVPGEIRVLHVDDDPDLADLVSTFLEHEDDRFEVETATSADAGLDRLTRAEFDCLVSDYDMPGQDGIAFLERVRADYPDLPFILYTGKGSEEVASDAISAGVTDYLQKGGGTDQYAVLANRIINAVEHYRSQHALARRNEELRRYERMVNSLHEAACIYDAEGRFELVNEYLADWYGSTRAALEGERSALIPRIRERAEGDPYRELLDGERTELRGELAGDFPDHGHAVVEYRLTPLIVDGTVKAVVGVARDITERKERERELDLKNRAMDEAPVGITISDPLREDNPLIYANDRFEQLTGYSEADTLGRNCRFLQGGNTDPDPVARMRAAIDAREPVTVELRNYREDGTEFWNRVTIAPITDETGALTNFVGFQEDVTGRKERERERERTLEFLQTLYDVATDADLAVDEKIDRLLTIGHEKLDLPYGHLTRIEVDDDEPGGGTQTIIEATGDHDLLQPGDSCPLSQSYCRKTIVREGLVAIHDVREAGWAGDPAYEVFDLGCYIGTRITVDDELYGTVFFASAAPREEPFTDAERTLVRLVSQLVRYELEREVCDSEHLEAAARAHGRMGGLIDDLLAVARVGEQAYDRERVDLAALAETSWRAVEAPEATLGVETDRAIRADRSHLRQLLTNLFANAVEHAGPDVTVTVGELDDGFYVADDGPGVPEGARERIFDAGYSSESGGTGFGLTIVERIADAHGWEVSAAGDDDGGARFEITGVDFPE